MKRAIILLMDSFGVGASLDAFKYGDEGADTFGNIFLAAAEGKADNSIRKGPLEIPNLLKLGLGHLALSSTAKRLPGMDYTITPAAAFGYAVETSFGKDTPSGHWEIAGVPVHFDWGYFPPEFPSFPETLVNEFVSRGNIPGILANKHASGTTVINEFGDEHIKTGKPIVYTSADSVFQIAAHEKYFGLEKLYALCDIARELVNDYNIGRVIARPFVGSSGNYTRTANRRDLSVPPPGPTILDKLVAANGKVIAIGKTADIFAHQGVSEVIKADGNMALFDQTEIALSKASDNTLIFTNFVDFDSKYGHRRDAAGYANALEEFDKRLPAFIEQLQEDDIVMITADHGCDPTKPGSDHTREHIPVIMFGPKVKSDFLGRRDTFADIGQTLAEYFDLDMMEYGNSFLQ
jgi:phosphopentomutase